MSTAAAIVSSAWRNEEGDLPDVRALAGFFIIDKADAEALCDPLHDFAEGSEALDRGETVRAQNQFGFQILHMVEGAAIGVGARRVWR
jgi:hypothetical protein